MEIRHAAKEDLDALVRVEEACFSPAEAASRESLAERIECYGSHFWLLYDGGRLASFVDGMVTDAPDLLDEMFENAALHDEDGAWQMIFGVSTDPEYRRRGCAGRLIAQAVADARAQGRKGVVLTCKPHLLHYYARFGFVDEGVTEKSVHGGAVWHQMRVTF